MATWDLQASAGATGKSILWRGTWSSASSYNPYDAVYSGGSSYISKTNNANKDPVSNPSDWDVLAAGANLLFRLSRNWLAGLTLANNVTDAVNDINIAVGECRDDTNSADIALASALTKRLDANWVAGTNQGGLDTGTIANTSYHVFAIRNPTTGVCDVLFSASATAPTYPSGYTQKRRIGSIMRVAAAIVPFTQMGDEFLRMVCIQTVSSGILNNTGQVLYSGVPTGIRVSALVTLEYSDAGTIYGWVSSPDVTDVAAGAGCFNMLTISTCQVAVFSGYVRTDTSGQIRARTDVTTGATVNLFGFGWIDTRGKDG